MSKKTIVLLSDMHVGNRAGLSCRPVNDTQKKLLSLWKESISSSPKNPDMLIVVGDAIDGEQKKSGGVDCVFPLQEQQFQACELLEMWKAKEVFVINGTAYHVGDDSQEKSVAALLKKGGTKSTFVEKLNILVNDWFKVECRHFVNSSGVPTTRTSTGSRVKVWNVLNAYQGKSQAPDLLVFGHVHYYSFSEDAFGSVLTLPAWEAVGSHYGNVKCDGHVDIGYVVLTVGNTKEEGWSCAKNLFSARTTPRVVKR